MTIAGTLTATPDPTFAPPRMTVSWTVTATGGSGEIAAANLSAYRHMPDGTLVPVREGDPIAFTVLDGTHWIWTGWDYEAPHGQAVTYSIFNNATQLDTATVSSSATVDPDPAQQWLIHPGTPTLSLPIDIAAMADVTQPSTMARQRPLGRRRAIVITAGARGDDEGAWTLNVPTPAGKRDLEDLLADEVPLLMQLPAIGGHDPYYNYLAIGDVTWTLTSASTEIPFYRPTMPYFVVDRPVGPAQSARTWADVVAEDATWASVAAHYATWGDLLAGRRT